MIRYYRYIHAIVIISLLVPGLVLGNDLDDGIALDESINDDLKPSVNIPFILMKVKAAQSRKGQGIESSRPVITQGLGGQGNIIIGPGTKLRPGTTIINSSVIKNSNSISR